MSPSDMVAIIVTMGCITTFGITVTALWMNHRQKMMELKLKLQRPNETNTQALDALREEVRALRDNAMQYDLSFDAALQRMEQRMNGVEQRVRSMEENQNVEQRIGR